MKREIYTINYADRFFPPLIYDMSKAEAFTKSQTMQNIQTLSFDIQQFNVCSAEKDQIKWN